MNIFLRFGMSVLLVQTLAINGMQKSGQAFNDKNNSSGSPQENSSSEARKQEICSKDSEAAQILSDLSQYNRGKSKKN